ncbi:OmpP1/FadL family transporter [Zoogloea sp.]|uniref:OmpP1/FadL family transporter n=1 Tax=Zoogloea sp. TaxID=49181 RepID=UPI0035AEC136
MRNVMEPSVIPLVLSALAFSSSATAAGFQLMEQNGSGLGTAYAGQAAVAEDASTIYFNPAGMSYLAGTHNFSVVGTLISRSTRFSDQGTTPMPVINPRTGAPIGSFHPAGGDGGEGGGVHAIPAIYYAYALAPDWRLGLGIGPTFADETEYDSTFIGRFSGQKTRIRHININPSVAYRVNERLSLGAGVNYVDSKIEFTQATPYVGAPLGRLKGDGRAWGYNLGLMYQLDEATRLGVSYRSKVKVDLDGTQTVLGLIDRAITASIETPDTLSIALQHKLNERWTLLGDYSWTGWSSLQALEPKVAASGAAATAPLRYNFKDTWRVGVGATWQYNQDWKLRAGTAFDKNPIPDDTSRTMTVPDADRIWLAFGAKWAVAPNTSLDFGYAHLFLKDTHTARAVTNTAETVTLQTVRGKFENSVDLLSVQLNYAF